MTQDDLPVRVAAFYRFARFADPDGVRALLAGVCRRHEVKGTLIVAAEGLNGTLAGNDAAIDAVLAQVRTLPGCADLRPRDSRAATMPFDRLKVRLKREIVTMGVSAIDPLAGVGDYVDPADWNALIDASDTIVVDTRNAHEVALGSFAGAIDPHTGSFRDFPDWFRAFRRTLDPAAPQPRIALFCTGGIRCEKATALLKAEGLDRVHHLRGGILAYLDAVPPEDSRWQGECFVFDQRVTLGEGLRPVATTLCPRCQQRIGDDGCQTCRAGAW